jgi:hypothetical protein
LKFKKDKLSLIRYEKTKQPKQVIPGEELEVARNTDRYKEVIALNKGNPIYSAFGNTKRFRNSQGNIYHYYTNEVIPESPSIKDIHSGRLDKIVDENGEPTAEFGK